MKLLCKLELKCLKSDPCMYTYSEAVQAEADEF